MTASSPATDPAVAPLVYPGNGRIHISVGNHEITILPHEVAPLIDQMIEAKGLVR